MRENVSSASIRMSFTMVMPHGGTEESPGPLPAVKVVSHVTPTKSTGSVLKE